MVRFAEVGRHQLRYGSRRLGGALGSVLARASLLMKEWGPDPDEEPDHWLGLEASVLGAGVLVAYGSAAYLLFTSFLAR